MTQTGPYRALKFKTRAGFVEESRCDVRRPWYLAHNYLRLQMLTLALHPEPQDALVIGLGGGALSNQLRQALPTARIDSVELDPLVARVAKRFFFYRDPAIVGDGRAYLQGTDRTYDLIFLDAFDGLEIPGPLRTLEFYQLVHRHLKPGGVVATNLHTRSKLYSSDRQTLGTVFQNLYTFQDMAQVIVLCQDGERRDRAWIADQAGRLTLPYPMQKLADSLVDQPDWNAEAPVLRD